MINKIVASYIMFACLLAVALYLWGVRAPVHLSTYFQAFIVQTNKDLENFKIAIPNIEHIDVQGVVDYLESNNIITAFVRFVEGFYTFINFLITILNFLVLAINTIVQVLEFIFIFIKNLIVMKESVPLAYTIV